MRHWNFSWDMNSDGLVTISDVWEWIVWLFFYPGDFILSFILKIPAVANFLELSVSSYGGWLSGIISGFLWLFVPIWLFGAVIFGLEEASKDEAEQRSAAPYSWDEDVP